MLVADSGTTTRRQAPIPDGPSVAPLVPTGTSDRVAVLHMELPAGGSLPDHSHGPSEIVLVPLSGTFTVRHDGQEHRLAAGAAAHIATGERVSLHNPGDEPARLMIVASPPDFAAHPESWPTA
ncbi:MAG TPA: cupin domain-containing protein [Streptomyces sp.]|nr:cupin domain-containing protein [Streptomyces sp.]